MILKISFGLLISFVILSSCTDLVDGAKNTVIKQYVNAAGNRKAIVFLKESGATVEDSYQVLVTNMDHIVENSENGNTFTVDTNHGRTRLDSECLNLSWISNDTLLIEYDKKLRTFIKEAKVDGVSNLYRHKK
jgi:hypothetical protein